MWPHQPSHQGINLASAAPTSNFSTFSFHVPNFHHSTTCLEEREPAHTAGPMDRNKTTLSTHVLCSYIRPNGATLACRWHRSLLRRPRPCTVHAVCRRDAVEESRFSSRAFSNCSSHFSSPVISSLKNQLLPEPGKLFPTSPLQAWASEQSVAASHTAQREESCVCWFGFIAYFLKTPNCFLCELCAVWRLCQHTHKMIEFCIPVCVIFMIFLMDLAI